MATKRKRSYANLNQSYVVLVLAIVIGWLSYQMFRQVDINYHLDEWDVYEDRQIIEEMPQKALVTRENDVPSGEPGAIYYDYIYLWESGFLSRINEHIINVEYGFSASDNCERIAYTMNYENSDSKLVVVDTVTGQVFEDLRRDEGGHVWPAISPNGQYVVYYYAESDPFTRSIYVWNLANNRHTEILDLKQDVSIGDTRWSDDSSQLALAFELEDPREDQFEGLAGYSLISLPSLVSEGINRDQFAEFGNSRRLLVDFNHEFEDGTNVGQVVPCE